MQENHVVRMREDTPMQRALTTALVKIADAAKTHGVEREQLEQLLLLRLVCSHAAIPFELREPEREAIPRLS
jgi:antitoxin component of RelBE/YafQ-DinJ toxin-antitoxin module